MFVMQLAVEFSDERLDTKPSEYPMNELVRRDRTENDNGIFGVRFPVGHCRVESKLLRTVS